MPCSRVIHSHKGGMGENETAIYICRSGFWFKIYWPAFTALDALKDCSKSAMMSSMCSVPTEIRIASSATPESRRSWLLSCWCVVDQGWMARVLESPTLLSQLDGFSIGDKKKKGRGKEAYFARFEINLNPSTTWLPAVAPPLTPKDRTPPKPRGR